MLHVSELDVSNVSESDVSQAGPTISAAFIRETQSDQTEFSVVA